MIPIRPSFNKYRAAAQVLTRSRDQLMEELAEEVLDRDAELSDSAFLLHELVEIQGTRLHFISMLLGQLEASAEALEERRAAEERRQVQQQQQQQQQLEQAAAVVPKAPRKRSTSTSSKQARAGGAQPAARSRKANKDKG